MSTPSSLSDLRLAQSDRGVVARCPCCDDLDLEFDGVGVTLSSAQLRQMRRTLAAVQAEKDARWGWALRTETTRESAVFRLVGDDAEDLAGLLDAAVAVLDLDALLLNALAPRPTA